MSNIKKAGKRAGFVIWLYKQLTDHATATGFPVSSFISRNIPVTGSQCQEYQA